jgi:hypothetical protein
MTGLEDPLMLNADRYSDEVLRTSHFDPSEASLPEAIEPTAWEEVASGRYQPRRIRGSYIGRALG